MLKAQQHDIWICNPKGAVIEKLTLVLGGARSGKSGYAIDMCERSGLKLTYVATAEARDEEMTARIALHKSRRSKTWQTVEEPLDLAQTLKRECGHGTIVVVDCLTLWLSNLFLSDHDAKAEIVELLVTLKSLAGPVVMVSNEVGLGVVPENALARSFRDVQGALNQKLARKADLVIFMAAGLPMVLKNPMK